MVDIDETLLYAIQIKDKEPTSGFDHEFQLSSGIVRLKMRPHALELLRFLKEKFDVWIYSNGVAEYVGHVIKYIAERGVAIEKEKVLSRENNICQKKLSK